MTLPAGEQQTLDGIAETLRASEPRLASMFAIFGRLCRNDGPPLRERLPVARRFALLTRLRYGRGGSPPAGPRTDSARRTVRPWQLLFVFANVVAALVILAVLMVLNTHQAGGCAARPSRSAQVLAAHGEYCPAQAGSGGSAPQK